MRIVALLTVPCAVALLLAVAASHLVGGPSKHPVTASAQSIVWNDRVFFNREQLAKWLHSRGASYDVWAKNHPRPTVVAPPPASAKSGIHLPSKHTMLVGAAAAGLVALAALLTLLLRGAFLFLRERELPRPSLPSRRRAEPDLTPMGALAYERAPERPEFFRLRRRLDVGFALAASSVGVGLALVLPHL